MRHRTSTLAALAALFALQVGCAQAAGDAVETAAPTTTATEQTATSTTVDAEALTEFYAAVLATTTTTVPPTTAPAPVAATPPTTAPTTVTTVATTVPTPAVSPSGSGRCGGDLPPCYVMTRESGGDPHVWNGGCYAPVGHTGLSPCGVSDASGKWQFLRSTWAGFGGYLNAADAPEAVQDDKARLAWAGGAGCGHWSACS